MTTKEQLYKGFIAYIDAEVIPALPTSGKWIAGTALILGSDKYNSLIDELVKNPIVTALGIVDKNGLIDAHALLTALEKSAEKYGVMEITIPLIGNLKFKAEDAGKLKKYIMGD